MSHKKTVYPIAEIFSSVQGEGVWSGTAMAFVRLAGCNVGKPFPPFTRTDGVRAYQEECTDWAGYKFACDTNYQTHSRMTAKEIVTTEEVKNATRVSITGGEPLIHDLETLLIELFKADKYVHLETSGTKNLYDIRQLTYRHTEDESRLWIVVSPKQGYLATSLLFANEIRVLVGPDFEVEAFEKEFGSFFDGSNLVKSGLTSVWLSPVNGVDILDTQNMQHCIEIQKRFPQVRISMQLHKILGVR